MKVYRNVIVKGAPLPALKYEPDATLLKLRMQSNIFMQIYIKGQCAMMLIDGTDYMQKCRIIVHNASKNVIASLIKIIALCCCKTNIDSYSMQVSFQAHNSSLHFCLLKKI